MSGSDASRPASPGTPQSDTPESLTPRRKVAAFLAQFSDSDSDTVSRVRAALPAKPTTSAKRHDTSTTIAARDSSDTDDARPRGKVARRLLGKTSTLQQNDGKENQGVILDLEQRDIQKNATIESTEQADATSPSNDETTATVSRRQLPTRRENTPRDEDQRPPASRVRSASPLFFSSPGSAPRSPVPHASQANQTAHKSKEPEHGRSKFLALVDKHRRERLAREAAKATERMASNEEHNQPEAPRKYGPRGSSPADDSQEDDGSDSGAAQRISKQARPTRKASKKALEEMNRETQRMNRNMQLAHQARTKKKITKESLLARFNFLPSAAISQPTNQAGSSDLSSTAGSDDEVAKGHDTPPTSPLQEPPWDPKANIPHSASPAVEMVGALAVDDDFAESHNTKLNMTGGIGYEKIQEYMRHDRTVFSPDPQNLDVRVSLTSMARNPDLATGSKLTSAGFQAKLLPLATSGSDSEIEIVQDKGLRRKFAAFETLPKRKAKEKPSHLALRSLAHLMGNDDRNKSMNTAQMEVSLRRRARLQAIEERKQKIEELKAKGIVIQSAEERERDQQEVEDIVERARQEAAEIQKREKELAKKDGTYVKDHLDDDEDDSDEDFNDATDQEDDDEASGSEDEVQHQVEGNPSSHLVDDEVDEADSEGSDEEEDETEIDEPHEEDGQQAFVAPGRAVRRSRIVSDEEDEVEDHNDKENQSPAALPPAKTPQSLSRSARKTIPGLHMSDDLPMGLSQAFAATMAESEDDEPQLELHNQDSFDMIADLPSPNIAAVPPLQRLDSIDMVSDSQPATQTQPLNINLNFSQVQAVPESPSRGLGISAPHFTPSQRPFDLTQDEGYLLSPFSGSRFAETPSRHAPHSTVDTLILPTDAEAGDSPVMARKGKLRRGRVVDDEVDVEEDTAETAFQVMKRAASRKAAEDAFDKSKSEARKHFDEAAEESEDEYAGLGGASDDDIDEEENEEDRRMIDEDTQVGVGDEAKLAGFYADRERERDEKDVSKLLKDITTGGLRRKRGLGDDLDLSDEEDAVARRREAKRREFARMRRELLKDEAVGKIAEDRKKEAFLRSIEDREEAEDEDDTVEAETQDDSESQSQNLNDRIVVADSQEDSEMGQKKRKPFSTAADSQLNRLPASLRRTNVNINRKPSNLAEIRESVSFLVEEPDSQSGIIDLGLSDSEDEPEAYVNLDRHLREAENDENILNDDDAEDLGDFIVDDDDKEETPEFKKPHLPVKDRAPFSERRTKRELVIDRLSLLRQASSSSSGSTASSKMAFYSSKSGLSAGSGVPSLLRRATTNSSLGSMSSRENVSATGVSTSNKNNRTASRTERGDAMSEKEFIRKGSSGRRNAVNFQARTNLKEEKMSQRAGIVKASAKAKKKGGNGFLNGLFRGDSWS